ncbi:FliM/FliN family flagellar motor switch protein [Silicimonas sp. MF1-12-2]|uniref:FliM/FliN family flagellar motor switch protein n=1 Tax=Silicimonas sp. MF1-12-2 TaxID=3384793 RepID=UPI0039B631FA
MPETDAQTVMRRKLAPPRPPTVPGQGALQHMLAKTMPRDAEELLGLQVMVIEVTPAQQNKADVIAALTPHDLVYMMKSDKRSPGLCVLSPALLSALIEMQMSGRVSSGEPTDRVPTRTDGIVASDIVDRWISTAKTEAGHQEIADRVPFADHYRAGTVANARAADLALDPGEFRTLQVTLELAGGAKTGRLLFAIPVPKPYQGQANKGLAEEFCGAIVETRTKLSVVLTRLPSTLGQVSGLALGDVLEVPITALQAVSVEGHEGEQVATARLGQAGGKKAVRLLGQEPSAGPSLPGPGTSDFLGAALPAASRVVPNKNGGTSDMPGLSDLPELPDFPDLPELPDLPDLPD